jgi:hypothetical protein
MIRHRAGLGRLEQSGMHNSKSQWKKECINPGILLSILDHNPMAVGLHTGQDDVSRERE